MLNGKAVLVTGGTGSFGKKFVETILKRYPEVSRLLVYSWDSYPHPGVTFDDLDKNRIDLFFKK
ncbi:MAG: polysaccharide biosynthesis protein [Bacteroidetes bacterium]|nr:polysaccharide biosynthesis protein [Bacteroidota bacterium]MBU1719758.1 polysaccharide biosynthesis protein [Bacteroidota bacterium]